jgi:spore germination protein KC
MIYFSKKFAEDGLFKFIDYFNRNHESRRYVNLAITEDNSNYETLATGETGEIPSNYVENLFENSSSNGKSVSIKLNDFLKAYYTEGIEPVVGVFKSANRIQGKPEEKDSKKEGNKIPDIEGLAVFRDDKLIGYFDGTETRGYNFITGKLDSCLIVSDSLDGMGKNSVEVIKSSSKIKVDAKDQKYDATVEIKINAMLGTATGAEPITNLDYIKVIEERTSENVKTEVEKSIQKAKEYHSDIFGFGQAIHISNPKKWKEIKDKWNDEFTNINVNIIVKTDLQRIGVESQQLSVTESR